MNQTTEAKNYICVNCKLVTNHKQKRCIQCGCQTHEQTAADVTYPADTRHEAMTPSNTEGQEPKTDNELIAEFMGIKTSKFYGYQMPTLKYHESWDWLMEVVDKIGKITFKWESKHESGVDSHYLRTFGMIDEETGRVMVRINNCGLHFGETLIEATYKAVLEFIKWHNANQPKP